MGKEQIIKALECYQKEMICAVVDENNRTHFITNADALALIKELTEENERLRAELDKRPKKLVITKLNTEEQQ